LDYAGRLWLASSRSGLIRVDDPAAEKSTFIGYTTLQNLSSDNAEVITDWFPVPAIDAGVRVAARKRS
jgi:hypothetical protein